MRKIFFCLAAIVLITTGFSEPSKSLAENNLEVKTTNYSRLSSYLQEAFEIQIRNLNFALMQKPADSEINRNNFLQISRHTLGSDLRPDIKITLPRLEIICKPRLELRWRHWREGPDEGDSDSDLDTFVNEWLVRVALLDDLFLSYGREDLQWGPAFLLSPSNPFYTENGRNHPKSEVAGADYARLVWAPGQNWTISLIANLDEGQKELYFDFKKTYAAKIDYLTDNAYFSAILSKQESVDPRYGGFCSWNVSDASLLYAEGSLCKDEVEVLLGVSYTMLGGATINLEYFYNGDGTRDDSLLFHLISLELDSARESLWRKNYLFIQYYDHDPMDDWSFLLRGTACLDDDSYTILAYGDYNVGDHTQFFVSGTLYQGDRKSEFGSFFDYSLTAGVEFIF